MRHWALAAVVLFVSCGSLNAKPESRALGFAQVGPQVVQVVDPTPTDSPAVAVTTPPDPTPVLTPDPVITPTPTVAPTVAPTPAPTPEPTPGHIRYAGLVTDALGAPIAGVCVYAGPPAGCPVGAPRTDANGAWWVDLPMGIAFLWNFEATGFQPTTLSSSASVRMTAVAVPTAAPIAAPTSAPVSSAPAPAAPTIAPTAAPTAAPTPAPVATTLTATAAPGLVIACVSDQNGQRMNGQQVTIQKVSGASTTLVSLGVQTTGTGGTEPGCAAFAWRVGPAGTDVYRVISGNLSQLVNVSSQ